MTDSLRRALRSVLWLLIAAVAAVPSAAAVFNLPAEKATGVVAMLTPFVLAVTKIVNALEDNGTIPALLKAPASSGENPLPDEAGQSTVFVVVATLAGVAILLWMLGIIPPD